MGEPFEMCQAGMNECVNIMEHWHLEDLGRGLGVMRQGDSGDGLMHLEPPMAPDIAMYIAALPLLI